MKLSLAIALTVLALPATALGAVGDLDPTFGSGGRVLLPVATGSNDTQVLDAVVKPDGKIVLVGVAYQGSDANGFLAQLNPSGSLDRGFGTNGFTVTAVNMTPNGDDFFRDVALAPGGRLVVGGDAQAASGSDIAVGRYGANGQPDGTFGGGDGIFTVSLRTFDSGQAVGVLPDGSPVVAGSASDGISTNASAAVARVLPNGSGLNPGFGPGGAAFTNLGGARLDEWGDLKVRTGGGDDTITVGGGADVALATTDFALGRFDAATGMAVPAFNGGAFATPGPGAEVINAIALLPDGGVLAAGQGNQSNVSAFQIASYTPTGELDGGFDGDGQTRVEFPFTNVNFAGASSAAIDPDRRILVGGGAFTRPFPATDGADFAFARLGPTGSVDLKRTYDVGGANDFALDLELAGVDSALSALLAGTSFSGGREVASAIKIDLAGVGTGPPPPPPAGTTPAAGPRLEITKTMTPGHAAFLGGEVARGALINVEILVKNVGDAPARDVVVTDDALATYFSDMFPSAYGTARQPPNTVLGDAGTSTIRGLQRTCRREILGPGQTLWCAMVLQLGAEGEGVASNGATAAATGLERVEAAAVLRYSDPRARITDVGPRFVEGTAGAVAGVSQANRRRRIVRVEVALRRRGGSRRTCRWVAGRRAGLRRVKPGRGRACDRPVWLRARGKRRWRYTFTRRLPRGRYTLMARATNAAGAVEATFSARRRNHGRLTIGRRR